MNSSEKIPLSKYKEIFRENKEIAGFSDFIKNYVKSIMENNNCNFGKKELESFKVYLEKIKKYHKITEKIKGKDIDIELTQIFIMDNSLEEFEEIINTHKIGKLINNGYTDNIKLLFSPEFFNIKNKKDFENQMNDENWRDLKFIIKFAKTELIKLMFSENFYDIKNKDLNNVISKDFYKIMDLIRHFNFDSVKLIFSEDFYDIQNKKDFEDLVKSSIWEDLAKFMRLPFNPSLKLLLSEKFYNVKDKDSLEKFLADENLEQIISFIYNISTKQLEMLFSEKYYNITDKASFQNLISDKKWKNIKSIIYYSPEQEEVVDLIFGKEFFNVNDKESLENLMKSRLGSKVIELLRHGQNEIVKLFFSENFYDIKNIDDLKGFLKNKNWSRITNLIYFGNKESIRFFIGNLLKNKAIFEILLDDSDRLEIVDLFKIGNLENIKLLFSKKFYNIRNIDDLKLLPKNKHWKSIKYIINKGASNDIKQIFSHLNIKNRKDFELMLEGKNGEHIKKIIAHGRLKDIKKIENGNSLVQYNGSVENIKVNIGHCDENEEYNRNILNGREAGYILVKIDNKIVGYIKKVGEKSFLAFENVVDKEGNLIFAKGMIYKLIFKDDGRNVINLKGKIKRNPMRFIKIINFDKLVSAFLKNLN